MTITEWAARKLRYYYRLPKSEPLARLLINCANRYFPNRYTDADPYKLLWISPHSVSLSNHAAPEKFGRVYSGDWDINATPFKQLERVRSLRAHFLDGKPWHKTSFYRSSLTDISRHGEDEYGCQTEEELNERFQRIDDLFQRVQQQGYQPQRDLLESNPQTTRKLNNDEPAPKHNEIGVNIGRDGQFIFRRCGLHRLTVAQILDLHKVAVQVRSRHVKWQQKRGAVRHGERVEHDDHPDLVDMIK